MGVGSRNFVDVPTGLATRAVVDEVGVINALAYLRATAA